METKVKATNGNGKSKDLKNVMVVTVPKMITEGTKEHEIKAEDQINESDAKFAQMEKMIQALIKEKDEQKQRIQELENSTKNKLSLEEAKRLYERRESLISVCNTFVSKSDEINTVLQDLANVIESDESLSFRLKLEAIDGSARNAQIFSTSNLLIIKATLKHTQDEVLKKIIDLKNEIYQINQM